MDGEATHQHPKIIIFRLLAEMQTVGDNQVSGL
jgi:hypothetical protein